MNATGFVVIYFVPIAHYVIADAELEFISASPLGLFTWRRFGQGDQPAGGIGIAKIPIEEAMTNHSVTLCERLKSFSDKPMGAKLAQHITEVLFRGVQDAVNQHESNWQFFHSESFRLNVRLLDRLNHQMVS